MAGASRAPHLQEDDRPIFGPELPAANDPPLQTFNIGRSVQGRPIVATSVGSGPVAVAFIGNIHGGWEPLARDVVDVGLEYFRDNLSEVPADVVLYFVPTVNPDGYEAGRPLWADATGRGGRGDVALAPTAFNAHGVDLNRNFGTKWTSDACGGERVRLSHGTLCHPGLGGPHPFSEPETQAYSDFILERDIRVALTYHEDQSPAVLIREGGGGPSEPFAQELAELFGYPYVPRTQAYTVTGHAHDWLDAHGVVGAEIELEYRQLDRDANIVAMSLAIEQALALPARS